MVQAKAKPVLLLIDDSVMLGKRVLVLIKNTCQVQVCGQATTLKEGYKMIEEHKPHIVLLDLSLPDGYGFEILIYIKTKLPLTKVVILSNCSDAIHQTKAYQLKADMFLDKTRDFPRLAYVIEEMINALA